MNIAQMIGEDHTRLADGAGRLAALAGENGDVLQPAERAEKHLAEEGEGAQVARREAGEGREWMGMCSRERPERKRMSTKDGQHGAAADVVDPLAQLDPAARQ